MTISRDELCELLAVAYENLKEQQKVLVDLVMDVHSLKTLLTGEQAGILQEAKHLAIYESSGISLLRDQRYDQVISRLLGV